MLSLRFSTHAGDVELACEEASAPALQRLRTRFSSATTRSRTSVSVGIDDFLLNLQELGTWPDEDFRWQPELLALVEGNYRDALVIEDRVANVRDDEADLALVPAAPWGAPLTDFQRRDLGHLLQLRHGANLSVPGAGKTRVTLALFQYRRTTSPVQRMLVVAPKSAFEAWRDEARVCFPAGLTVAQLQSAHAPECDVLLVNYERLPDSAATLLRWLRAQPALLVLDEAHRMKLGSVGAWGSVCYMLGPFAEHRVILTGTPAPNGKQDLANLFGFVWPGQGRSAVRHALDGRSLAEASALLKPLFTRTTKAELGLPPVTPVYRRVELPPLHREIYDALLGIARRGYPGGVTGAEELGKIVMYLLMAATSPALVAAGGSRHEPLAYRVPPLTPRPDSTLARLMRDLPSFEMSPKHAEALSIVRQNAAAGRKTLVWSTFVRNLTSLERLLARYSPALVHGGTTDREEQLRRFREDPQCMVLLSNPATLGEGVSLHHTCHEAVYVDRDFAAGRYLQSLDRIHRLGLEPGALTRITILIADRTIDEVVQQRLDTKVNFLLRVLDDPAVQQLTDLDEEPSTYAGMDDADLRALIEYVNGDAPA